MVFIVYTDNSNVKDTMVSALFACWPIVLIPFIMAYIAGFFIWVLVRAFMFLFVQIVQIVIDKALFWNLKSP